MKASDKDLNRKAFPKFLLWVGGGALVGFCAGLASGILGDLNAGAWASVRLPVLLGTIAPWGIPVSSVILLGICLAQYRSAKTLCDRWDGEDETAPDAVDQKLNVVLLCSSLAMILDFLFLGMGVLYTDGEAAEAAILRKLRMNGLANSNLEVIRHMDKEIETESDVIPVALKNGILQEAKSSAAGGKRFSRLTGFVKDSLIRMGEEILDGETAVNPYKQGNRTACDYCPYHSICGFDLKTKGYGFRRFRPMKAEEIWKEIEGEEEEDGENG